jgi:hypothetical protein
MVNGTLFNDKNLVYVLKLMNNSAKLSKINFNFFLIPLPSKQSCQGFGT